MPKAITSLTGYIRKIEKMYQASDGSLFYRGHPHHSYELTPSIFRIDGYKKNERDIIYRAISESPKEFDNDKYFFDKLVRAQHYGIPTRLLDVTINPLIALYFACESEINTRGQVIVLEAPKGDTKFFLSDAVSCKSNLAQLTTIEIANLSQEIIRSCKMKLGENFIKAGRLPTWRKNEPKLWSEVVEEFNAAKIVSRLVQFIREEKPHFEAKIDPIDLLKPDVVFPKKTTLEFPRNLARF